MDTKKTYKINNSSVTIKFGDILDSDAEALVISGSVGIPMIGGLPEIVKRRAGEGVVTDAAKHSKSKLGDVVVTSAGHLKNKYLFQAVTVIGYTQVSAHLTSDENEERIRACEYVIGHTISKCMRLLSAMDLNSIAFPCLGLGMANMSVDTVAKITAETISDHLKQTNRNIEVEIYIYDIYDVYNRFNYLPFFEWFAVFAHNNKRRDIMPIIIEPDINRMKAEIHKIEENPHRVFISYSSVDREKARFVCDILRQMNIKFWIDQEGIFSGSNYKELIVKAISSTDIILFLSSENSNNSQNVLKEISLADQYHKIIVPAHLDSSSMNPSIAYDLAGIDYLELHSFNETSISKLKNAILGQLSISDSMKQ